jgi:PQQ-dependent catabolism-associated CXXCW motif protein
MAWFNRPAAPLSRAASLLTLRKIMPTPVKKTPFKKTARSPAALARALLCCGLVLLAGSAFAQQSPGYADEDRDWGVPAMPRLRQEPYHAPTPLTIPGAAVVRTPELVAMLTGPTPPLLIDVLSGEGHLTLPGTAWLPGAGRGESFIDSVQAQLLPLLAQLTGGDKTKPMAFFCASSECWLSYNAALRAVAGGYSQVYWYRGGIDAWVAANLPTARTIGPRKSS